MGAISFNLDRELISELLQHLPMQLLVETGTFRGGSLAAVADLFPECLSIELSPEYAAAARARFADKTHIHLIQGDSAKVLHTERARFTGRPTLFWLDAHWCAADNTAGEISQCPLLAELAAIGTLPTDSAVLIDDARLFLGPPPKPHEGSAWPDFDAILRQLRQLSDRHALVHFNDVLLYIPADVLPKLKPYLREHAMNLLTLADKGRDYDRVLSQAKQKDIENSNLQTSLKERQTEIDALAKAADERLATIMKLDAGVQGLRGELESLRGAGASGPTLVDEVATLRLQLASARQQLAVKQRDLAQLRLSLDRSPGARKRLGVGSGLRQKWRAGIAAKTPHPLGQLRQYEPRPLVLEKFPRPPRLARWPRICVATPSYQQGAFLERTMLSVLGQNYPNLAYGVQDGGSTDDSPTLITKHIARLAHAESARDSGQSDAIRRGFAKLYPANNDIMAWVNSDDLLMPGALHYIGAYFARHPEVDVVYGHRVVIDEADREVGRWYLPQYHADTLRWFDLVPQETMFWRASCYHEIGGLDPAFQFALDWDLLLRFEQAGFAIKRLPHFLGCFRVHEAQKTSAHINSIGEHEMQRLRQRTHGRDVKPWEVLARLEVENQESAVVAWLHRHGWRS